MSAQSQQPDLQVVSSKMSPHGGSGTAQTHQAYPVKGTPTGLRARKEQQERFKEVMTRIHDESKMRAVADRKEIDKRIRKLEKSGSPAAQSTIIELQAKRKILTETIFRNAW